ncbi:MAG TPA: Nramp family divalent metal transporter [Bacteroidales bacterium]|nr:Nramp family divalent metal transporter [Bacteroidales bacterium]HPF02227.1 Nramp family divalent metal transporter [Bacteroidales bacterium]HPJ60425.1 Nramp family divalent metal transporter [Bacteroidales bacterium]HPR11963.1 Nramp family divalent metal transporter [Bacteroidales bacterium]HRW85745.1 Nramp family divalent metal transporter [Bacteroidales bacterium]
MPVKNTDPYLLSRDSILEPPEKISEKLRFLGPGFILSASIVGSGELIATTTLGAKAGFAALWILLLSCVIKVVIQLEFGKNAICHGKTVMSTFNDLPGWRIKGTNWTIWLWFLLWVVKPLQVGGVLGGVALTLSMWLPGIGVPVFTVLTAISVSILVYRGYYKTIQRFSVVMMLLFTIFTLTSLWFLHFTQHSFTWNNIAEGLKFRFPPGTVAIAIAAFGLTGVAGDEIVAYHYWCLEKGYARHTGPNDGSGQWTKRARGWMKIMYLDAIFSMVIYTVVTIAFYLLGASVLHNSQNIPEGFGMIESLSAMYTESLGLWAKSWFMLGAIIVLFSTLFAALAAWTRIFSDIFGQIGWINFFNLKQRKRTIVILAWVFPALWAISFLLVRLPVMMVTIGGAATSIMLLIVVYVAVNYKYRLSVPRLTSGNIYNIIFIISAISILLFSIYSLVEVFR